MQKNKNLKAIEAAITGHVGETVLRYVGSDAFAADIEALEPMQRLTIIERYMPYVAPRQTSSQNETTISASLDDDVMEMLDRLTID